MSKSSKLSIGYISSGWPPERCTNGIVTYVASIVEAMDQLGHQSYILTGSLYEKQQPSYSKKVIHLSYEPSNNLVTRLFDKVVARLHPETALKKGFVREVCPSVNALIATSGLDLIEMEESLGLARFLYDCLPIPIVVRLHGPWFLIGEALGGKKDAAFLRRVRNEERAIAKASCISAPSFDVLEQTRRYYNLPLEDAMVIPNPIASTPKEKRWHLKSCEPNVIAFIGRFDRNKGGDLIIDALAHVLKEFPNVQLIFAGPDRGYIDDKGRVWHFEEYLGERIPGALEAGQVQWLGTQPPSALRELRLRAQITVIPSRYETFSYTTLEAFNLGCPIIASRTGGMAEIVTDETTGLLFRPGDPGDLAAQIIRMLQNPSMAAKLGYQAGEECDRRFSPEVVAKQSVDFYRETLDRWRHSKLNFA